MKSKIIFFVVVALAIGGASVAPQTVRLARASGCEAAGRIDGSTAAEAKAKIERAGFRQVRNLKKGCDNFWHGVAVKDDNESNVVLTPQGRVMREGN